MEATRRLVSLEPLRIGGAGGGSENVVESIVGENEQDFGLPYEIIVVF